MAEEHSERTRWLRHRAKRLREIADSYATEVSPLLIQMAEEMEAWADDLDRRR